MPHFFATANDMLRLLLSIEEKRPLVYTWRGRHDSTQMRHYATARDLPTLFQPQPEESAVHGPCYIVTEAKANYVERQIVERWTVSRFLDLNHVSLQHGGQYGDHVLLPGRLTTVSKTIPSLALQRAFLEALQTQFVEVGSYQVGHEALQLLETGWRLTYAVQSPPAYDLRRPIPGIGPGAEVVYMRRSLLDTWRFLEAEGMAMPRRDDQSPFVLDTMPNHDADELGFSYFRSGLADADLSYLTLPRTFIGRSGFERVNFRHTDWTESRVCWNDFTECDFRHADLSNCDLRASVFAHCNFDNAVLRGADLRYSSFEGCTFRGADVTGAITAESGSSDDLINLLTEEQMDSMIRHDDPGEEPPGG